MKAGVASAATALVCALAAPAWAAGDPKACLDGDKKACLEIGKAYANQPPVGDVDEMRAECEKTKDEAACAGSILEGVKASCRNGKEGACRMMGESEARDIVEEAKGTTEELEAKCKTKNQQACVDFAVRLLDEERSEENTKRAKVLLDRGCKAGIGDGCGLLATLIMFSGKESDFKRGMELMKRGCSLGSKLSCGVNRPPGQRKIRKPGEKPIGVLQTVEDSQGRGTTGDARQVMKDLVKMDRLLHQNCKLGYADACAELEEPADPDAPVLRKQLGPAELAAKIRKLERQAAAGPAAKK